MPIGIYIHGPFCAKKCPYCDFYSQPFRKDTADAYTEAVIRNIRALLPAETQADTVYFGGGTPSLLPPDSLRRIMENVAAHCSLASDGEYTLTDNDTDQTGKWSSLEVAQDAFKLSHVDGYTLAVPSDVKVTKIAFIGKSLYQNLAGTITIITEGFTPSNASFIQNADEEGFVKYLSTIEFATSSLGYGDAVEFNPGGCESAAYIEIYGEKRNGPAAPESVASTPVTWDFTNLTAQSFTQNSSYSFKSNDGITEMRYSAGSSDAIVAKDGNTNGYLKENGTTSTSNSVVDIDGETVVGKNRLIRLYVSGKGMLTINCTSDRVGIYTVKDGSTNGKVLLSSYTANAQSSEITVSDFLWIETTTKGYIYTITWTPSSDGITLTTTANMAGWRERDAIR